MHCSEQHSDEEAAESFKEANSGNHSGDNNTKATTAQAQTTIAKSDVKKVKSHLSELMFPRRVKVTLIRQLKK